MASNLFELDGPIARRTDPHTSHESADASKETHKNVAEHILNLAAQRGRLGLTINEATEALQQFKAVSVSPVFKPLVNKGKLVRHLIGKKASGRARYVTRIDPETNCAGIVHYHFQVPLEHTPGEAVPAAPPRKPPLSTAGAEKARGLSAERRQGERRRGERRNARAVSKSR